MQKLSPEMMREAVEAVDDSIPSLEGTKHYFALVRHAGKRVLCLLDDTGTWKPTSYDEMMRLM